MYEMYSGPEMDGIGEGIIVDGVKIPLNHYIRPSPSCNPEGVITWKGGFYKEIEG